MSHNDVPSSLRHTQRDQAVELAWGQLIGRIGL